MIVASQGLGWHIPEDDGWTMRGYLAGVANVHPPFRFAYRPCTPPERSVILQALDGKSPQETDAILAKTLAARLKSWSISKTPGGDAAPITPAFLLRLFPGIFLRLCAIVIYGSQAPDTDPEAQESQSVGVNAESLEAAISGKSLKADGRVERLEKN